jgi:anthranilate phosphoribosyltransferase
VRSGGGLVDTCGTGGSGLPTTNTSTVCAFVLAAAGVPVAKHGNRASSGRCGSMDVLEELGVAIEIGPDAAGSLLADQGLAFLFAPLYHPAMRHVAPVRRSLGFRTVFNFLGPLCNPAGARRQLLGVSDPSMAPRMARALAGLGSERVLVVWGEDGLDELSLGAPTRTWELVDGELTEGRLTPEELGLEPASFEALAGGDRAENARHFLAILAGEDRGPRADHLALNAGAALMVAGRARDIAAGIEQARELVACGAVLERFEAYRAASRALSGDRK